MPNGKLSLQCEKLSGKTSALYPLHLLFQVRDLFPATHSNIVPDYQRQIWMEWLLLFNKVITLGGVFFPILIFLFLIRKQLFFKAKAWQRGDGVSGRKLQEQICKGKKRVQCNSCERFPPHLAAHLLDELTLLPRLSLLQQGLHGGRKRTVRRDRPRRIRDALRSPRPRDVRRGGSQVRPPPVPGCRARSFPPRPVPSHATPPFPGSAAAHRSPR